MYLLESLAEITGLPTVSLQPSAGSQGRAGRAALTRAYHDDQGRNPTRC